MWAVVARLVCVRAVCHVLIEECDRRQRCAIRGGVDREFHVAFAILSGLAVVLLGELRPCVSDYLSTTEFA